MPSGPKRLVVEENRPRAAWLACFDARRKPGPHTRSRVGGYDVWIEKSAFLSPFVSPRTTISLPTPWQRSSLLVEEALEGEVSDVVEPERYERAEAAAGYRIGYRPSTIKTAEGDGRLRSVAGAGHARAVRLGDPGGAGRAAGLKRWSSWRSSCMRAGCRRATSRTPLPTRAAGGCCGRAHRACGGSMTIVR